MDADVVIAGGGIAGLTLSIQLAMRERRVLLLEREAALCTHASGRNAAIFRHAEPASFLCGLAARSHHLYESWCPPAWLRRCGGMYLAKGREALEPIRQAMQQADIPHTLLWGDELRARMPPGFWHSGVRAGIHSPSDGVIQLEVLGEALLQRALALGVEIRCSTRAEGIVVEQGQVRGLRISGARAPSAASEFLPATALVVAAGAYASSLAEAAGLSLPLQPLRRHLYLIDAPGQADLPVYWRLDDELYLRGDAGGWLASPCDEEPHPPHAPGVSPERFTALADKLQSIGESCAPARVRDVWACLRTRTPDLAPVLGADPRATGLYWFAGLAGWGMTVAPAAAELVSAAICDDVSVPEAFGAARLLRSG